MKLIVRNKTERDGLQSTPGLGCLFTVIISQPLLLTFRLCPSILNIEYMKTTTKPRPVLDWEQENRSESYLIAAISSKLSTEPMNEIDREK